MSDLRTYRSSLDKAKGRLQELTRSIASNKEQLTEYKRSLRRHEQAREIIKEVGMKTQQSLQVHISDITTLAMEAVFDNPYELTVEFVQQRNKTECNILFTRDGNSVDPLEASGGGAVDVASFALRIASYTMQNPRSRNTIILDEPMRFLSVDMQERASQMIKELSDKLGIQFIIITHEDSLTRFADKIFEVTKRKGVSKVTEV